MLGKKSYVFSSADLKTINEYFEISVIEEDEEESRITVKGESNNFDNICLYSGERGRVIVIIEPRADYINNTDRADYTDYLLFSPTLEIESSALISDIVISGDSMEFLVKRVMKIISDFRVKLLKKLYSCKKTFNSNFRMICKAKSDFFDCCEDIANINPICKNEEEFKNMIINLYKFFEEFNKKDTEKFLGEDLGNKKNLKSLKEIFKKLGKENEVESRINELEIILSLRTTYAHSKATKHFTNFLEYFKIQYPTRDREYCDLSISVIERWIENINKMSEILKMI